ncbi:MAG: saccharopine dehydrogenase [Euryarchaeota archaeon]|nr:saccharopine dehydrogenase [Euryarchaeota archaeon]
MARKVLVLGAGMVSRPLVVYLLKHRFQVTVATRTVAKARALLGKHRSGKAVAWTTDDPDSLRKLVGRADLVVSLLPPAHHVAVGNVCLELGKHLLTTSYVGDAMRALDGPARERGLVFMNEIGLDPGIDHMSAMRIIHRVGRRGGKVVSFRSTTGALPSHGSNNNPFGYKFSWAPRGVLLASRNPARWLEDGREVNIPGERLFENYTLEEVEGVGTFENYPNRDSVQYRDIYGLKDARTVYRGTFRMPGWCETLRKVVALGWLDDRPVQGFAGRTYGDLTRHLVNAGPGEDLPAAVAAFLHLETYSAVIKRLGWLGLFGDEPLPAGRDNPLDYLNLLSLKRMALGKGDQDMIVMHHEFEVELPGGKGELLTSTLVDTGIAGGDSAVARTVSLPAAIAVRLILQGKLREPGVAIPVRPAVYHPILDELEKHGIVFKERRKGL